MKRRGFLVSSLAASALAGATASGDATALGPRRRRPAANTTNYESINCAAAAATKDQRFLSGCQHPGDEPPRHQASGRFQYRHRTGKPTLYVLTPHSSPESVVTIHDRVSADPEYLQAGAPFINATPAEPSYVRVESFLLAAFAGMPKLEVPPGAAENKPRISNYALTRVTA